MEHTGRSKHESRPKGDIRKDFCVGVKLFQVFDATYCTTQSPAAPALVCLSLPTKAPLRWKRIRAQLFDLGFNLREDLRVRPPAPPTRSPGNSISCHSSAVDWTSMETTPTANAFSKSILAIGTKHLLNVHYATDNGTL